jgi:hypothetical protein
MKSSGRVCEFLDTYIMQHRWIFHSFEPQLPPGFTLPAEWCLPKCETIPRPAWALRSARTRRTPVLYPYAEFPGNSLYEVSTPGSRRAGLVWPTGEDAVHKSQSIRYGISLYLPGELFKKYIFEWYLTRRSTSPSAIEQSLGNILQQFNLCRPGRSAPAELINEYLRLRPRQPDLTRVALMLSETRQYATEFTDMIVACLLCQAGVMTYLEEFQASVLRCSLTPQEQLRAQHVTTRSFETFHVFLIYAILLPLIILRRQELQGGKGETEEQLREAAIALAWDDFFDANLLRTDFTQDRMICPANQFLQFVRNEQILETIYRFVVEHREDEHIRRLTRDATKVVGAARAHQWYYYRYFLADGSVRAAMDRLRTTKEFNAV